MEAVAVDWAAAEGWNPGLHDAAIFHAADPQGFLVGVHEGEPVSCVSAVAYGDDFGFIGFYIVRPEYRGHGYGIRTWNAALERLAGRNIGLDGVVAQQDNYRKSGFRLAYRNIRYGVTLRDGAPSTEAVVDLSTVPFEAVEALDRSVFPAPRTEFLRRWVRQPAGAALGVLEEGRLAGCGVIRACREGHKVGPLFAESERTAEDLFRALAARAPDGPVFLDVPEPNRAAIALAERHGLTPVFETARMYTREAPAVALERIFGIATFELG